MMAGWMGCQPEVPARLVAWTRAAKWRAVRHFRLAETRPVGVTMHAYESPVEGRYEVST
jgi:hypothetical protein